MLNVWMWVLQQDFIRYTCLSHHIRSAHEEKKDIWNSECKFCKKKFTIDLSEHIASVHKGKKSFEWKFCDWFIAHITSSNSE